MGSFNGKGRDGGPGRRGRASRDRRRQVLPMLEDLENRRLLTSPPTWKPTWVATRGELRGARELLDRWRWGGGKASFVLATLEHGRLAERLGDWSAAMADYQYVAARWRQADAELQRYVSEARDGIGRLAGER